MRTRLLVGAAILLVPGTALGHARLNDPTPRSTADDLKTGPCGNVPRTATPSVFEPGETITIQFTETIEHPGHYRVAFSPAGDQGFDDNVLLDMIPDQTGAAPHNYSVQVTLPMMECSDCTLQLRQFMAGSAQPYYYSCADIVLLASAPPDAGPAEEADAGPPEPSPDAGAGAPGADGGPSVDDDGIGEPPGFCAVAAGAAGTPSAAAWLAAAVLALVLLRHRRGC